MRQQHTFGTSLTIYSIPNYRYVIVIKLGDRFLSEFIDDKFTIFFWYTHCFVFNLYCEKHHGIY